MATASGTTQEARYIAEFDAALRDAPDWLREQRTRAMDRFRVLGFPVGRRGNEYWKYTDVGPIARTEFTPEPANSAAVGSIPRGISVINLHGAKGGLAKTAEAQLGAHASFEDEAFSALNTALFDDAVLIHVDEGVSIGKTLRIALHSTEGAVAHPRVLIIAEPGSRLSVALGHYGHSASGYFTNIVTEVAVGEGASVTLHRAQRERAGSFHIATTAVTVERDAHFESFALDAGGGLVRHNLNVTLAAPGASCTLNGLYATSGDEHLDNHTFIHHASADTSSAELYKGVLTGSSHGVFMGRVHVPKDSQRIQTRQTNKSLLLSPKAEMDTQPMLEIYADDIQATHGSAVGQVDEEALFYLRSRGLSEAGAREVLVQGFVAEVLDAVENETLREEAARAVAAALAVS